LRPSRYSTPEDRENRSSMDLDRELTALSDATNAFGRLFEDDMGGARALFDGKDDPFHLIGHGVAAFLEAALGLEVRRT
jgi:hypothetical protein